MKLVIAIALTCVSIALGSAAYACDQDILCPANWVWSDDEGTCVEDPKTTSYTKSQ